MLCYVTQSVNYTNKIGLLMTLQQRDLQHFWHPCTQMKSHQTQPLLEIASASGVYLTTKDGKKIIDAISSWWCKSLGHGHPRLQQALTKQMEKFEHVIMAGTTNDTVVQLSEKLATLMPTLSKVFYAGDGSSAVEVAMKMSLHSRKLTSELQRTTFLALENSYHGETIGALSVSDLGLYRDPYAELLFPCHFIKSLPYVNDIDDPLWQNSEQHWQVLLKQLEPHCETATAIIVEPILQGAGGMKIYSQDFLRRLRAWTSANNIHLIADEIMTGMGRTGKMLASEHANVIPDFVCISKGLTSGWLPMSAVLTNNTIYNYFYADEKSKAFLHSHTFSGNALAASVALEALSVIEAEQIVTKSAQMGAKLLAAMTSIANVTQSLTNVRGIGAVVAADAVNSDIAAQICRDAIQHGALLRPLANTIYWCPPLILDDLTLNLLKKITEQAVKNS